MRKIICALMALLMTASLWACGQEDTTETTVATATESLETTASVAPRAAETEPSAEATQPATTVAATEPSATETTAPPEPAEVSLGTYKDLTYENSFIGAICTLPQGFTYRTAQEILQENSIPEDATAEKTRQLLQEADELLLMEAHREEDDGRISVRAVRKGAHPESVDVSAWLTRETQSMTSQMTAGGATKVTAEPVELYFATRTEMGMLLTAEKDGQESYGLVLVYEVAGYLVWVTITVPGLDTLDTLLLCLEIA